MPPNPWLVELLLKLRETERVSWSGKVRPSLANLAVYLLDPGSAYVNGQTIAIDGGGHLKGGGFSRLSEWGDAEWEQARNSIKGANEKDRAARTV